MGLFDPPENPGVSVKGKIKCAYCEGANLPKVSKEDADALRRTPGAPTHIKLKCGHCGNEFYWTKEIWPSNSATAEDYQGKSRKTSPGDNVWVKVTYNEKREW